MLFNPFIKIVYVYVNTPTDLNRRQTTGPDKLSYAPDTTPQVFGGLRDSQEPLF